MNTFVFGLQRTATNYVHHLLWKNFNCFARQPSSSKEPLWKHTPTPSTAFDQGLIPDDSMLVVVSKDPVMWVDSLIRKPMDADKCFESGDEEPAVSLRNKKIPLCKIVEYWNDYNTAWAPYIDNDHRISTVSQNVLVGEGWRERWLNNLAEKHGLEFEEGEPVDIDSTPLSRTFDEKVKQAYHDRKTEFLSDEQRDFINLYADMSLFERLYE
jgi:hypothetical protein